MISGTAWDIGLEVLGLRCIGLNVFSSGEYQYLGISGNYFMTSKKNQHQSSFEKVAEHQHQPTWGKGFLKLLSMRPKGPQEV